MSNTTQRAPFLPVLRELAQCYQAFERYSATHIQTLGLTPPQFDVVATLGNTPGMSFRELGEYTLITKGTLTGVIDRLEAKGIVNRERSSEDGRSTLVRLTCKGEEIFDQSFPAHISHLGEAFGQLCEKELSALGQGLGKLRKAFLAAADNQQETN